MSTATLNDNKGYRIMGMSIPMFAILTAIVLAGTYMEVLPTGMIGAFAIMMIIGAILNEIGNHMPIVKSYLGGGAIVVIFGSAALATYGIFPESTTNIITNFMKGEGFLDFYIAALITGSILGMSRDLLVKAAVRYMPAIVGSVAVALAFVGIVGAITGYGAAEAVMYIGIPIMGGGMGAGAVPLANIFGGSLNADPAQMLSTMVPAVALGNALAIVFGGILDRVGKKQPKLTGNGKLMAVEDDSMDKADQSEEKVGLSFGLMGQGLLISVTFFIIGRIIGNFFPQVHFYAWMIISVAVAKVFGLLPRQYEVSAFQWYQFMMANLTPALLVGIGVAYTDLTEVISALSIQYIILVGVTVFGAVIGGGLVGKLVGFYPIESAITAGLCMANMGGTGDVAVLSAADRMELMPFAQISSRIGGAFILILASTLLKLIF